MKNVPRWHPHHDVLWTSREHQFNALYKIYYYNTFKSIVSVNQQEKKQLSLLNVSEISERRLKVVLIAS